MSEPQNRIRRFEESELFVVILELIASCYEKGVMHAQIDPEDFTEHAFGTLVWTFITRALCRLARDYPEQLTLRSQVPFRLEIKGLGIVTTHRVGKHHESIWESFPNTSSNALSELIPTISSKIVPREYLADEGFEYSSELMTQPLGLSDKAIGPDLSAVDHFVLATFGNMKDGLTQVYLAVPKQRNSRGQISAWWYAKKLQQNSGDISAVLSDPLDGPTPLVDTALPPPVVLDEGQLSLRKREEGQSTSSGTAKPTPEE